MRSHRVGIAIVLLGLLVCFGSANVFAAGAVPNITPEVSRKLQAILDGARDDGLPGGIIVRVESLQTGAVWQGASGPFAEDQDGAIRVGDAFRVASITKSWTAAVIWRLQEEKKLSVDDLMSRYLPPAIVDHIDVLNGVSYGPRITIRQLLCHCSGIWDYAVENKNLMRYVFAHPNHQWEPMDYINIAIKDGKPYFKPGEGVHYSDTNYLLLGFIIEKVTGKPLVEAYREYIYRPLGLKDTYLEAREPAVGPRRTHNYVGYLDETNFNPTLDAWASGGQVSTTADLAHFITSVMTGHFFQSEATLRATLETPKLPATSHDGITSEWQPHYLYYSMTVKGVDFVGHSGYWGADMYYQPERQLVMTGTSDQTDRHLPLADIAKAFAGH